MRVGDILKVKSSSTIYGIEPSGTLAAAVAIMVERDVGSLVVMQNGEMVGLVTFREILSALHDQGGSLGKCSVEGVMVRDPKCGDPGDTVDQMRSLMTEHHIRYLPIKESGRLVGVLSFHDVARAALKAASLENRALKEYIKNWPEPE
jgi:CBS domain-containing protein